MPIILNAFSTECTYPGVAESHTDGSVDRHAELTLWPLHIKGEVGGQTHGNSRTEQQKKEATRERCHLHVP